MRRLYGSDDLFHDHLERDMSCAPQRHFVTAPRWVLPRRPGGLRPQNTMKPKGHHETSRHATVDVSGSPCLVRARIRAAAVAGRASAAGRRGRRAVAVAACAGVLVESQTRDRGRRTWRLHARLRSGQPRLALRRDVPVHVHGLADCRRVCTDLVRRRSPSHRDDRGVRAHQERLRRLSRHRPAAEDRRRPEGARGAVSVSCERRLVHRRAGECRQLPGAGSDRRRRSRARDAGRARLQLGGAGRRADARFTRQRRHADDGLVPECQQPGLSRSARRIVVVRRVSRGLARVLEARRRSRAGGAAVQLVDQRCARPPRRRR